MNKENNLLNDVNCTSNNSNNIVVMSNSNNKISYKSCNLNNSFNNNNKYNTDINNNNKNNNYFIINDINKCNKLKIYSYNNSLDNKNCLNKKNIINSNYFNNCLNKKTSHISISKNNEIDNKNESNKKNVLNSSLKSVIFFFTFNKTYTIINNYTTKDILKLLKEFQKDNFFILQIDNDPYLYEEISKESFSVDFEVYIGQMNALTLDYCFSPVNEYLYFNLSLINTILSDDIDKKLIQIIVHKSGIYINNKDNCKDILSIFVLNFHFKEIKNNNDFFKTANKLKAKEDIKVNDFNIKNILKNQLKFKSNNYFSKNKKKRKQKKKKNTKNVFNNSTLIVDNNANVNNNENIINNNTTKNNDYNINKTNNNNKKLFSNKCYKTKKKAYIRSNTIAGNNDEYYNTKSSSEDILNINEEELYINNDSDYNEVKSLNSNYINNNFERELEISDEVDNININKEYNKIFKYNNFDNKNNLDNISYNNSIEYIKSNEEFNNISNNKIYSSSSNNNSYKININNFKNKQKSSKSVLKLKKINRKITSIAKNYKSIIDKSKSYKFNDNENNQINNNKRKHTDNHYYYRTKEDKKHKIKYLLSNALKKRTHSIQNINISKNLLKNLNIFESIDAYDNELNLSNDDVDADLKIDEDDGYGEGEENSINMYDNNSNKSNIANNKAIINTSNIKSKNENTSQCNLENSCKHNSYYVRNKVHNKLSCHLFKKRSKINNSNNNIFYSVKNYKKNSKLSSKKTFKNNLLNSINKNNNYIQKSNSLNINGDKTLKIINYFDNLLTNEKDIKDNDNSNAITPRIIKNKNESQTLNKYKINYEIDNDNLSDKDYEKSLIFNNKNLNNINKRNKKNKLRLTKDALNYLNCLHNYKEESKNNFNKTNKNQTKNNNNRVILDNANINNNENINLHKIVEQDKSNESENITRNKDFQELNKKHSHNKNFNKSLISNKNKHIKNLNKTPKKSKIDNTNNNQNNNKMTKNNIKTNLVTKNTNNYKTNKNSLSKTNKSNSKRSSQMVQFTNFSTDDLIYWLLITSLEKLEQYGKNLILEANTLKGLYFKITEDERIGFFKRIHSLEISTQVIYQEVIIKKKFLKNSKSQFKNYNKLSNNFYFKSSFNFFIELMINKVIQLEIVIEKLQNIVRMIKENYSITIEDNTAQQNTKLNMVMKVLAIITTVYAPFDIVASLFGMNIPVPFQNNKTLWPFFGIIAILFVILLIQLAIFKKLKWF